MTQEEYEKLLKSDYWKGYSYSLIKERNFTCEDCGRQFPNERNKLQVHHLVYRDVNPWSYRPDEVIVLCEECHKKRHGIKDAPQQPTQDRLNGDSSSSSNGSWSEKSFSTSNGQYNRNREYNKSHRRGFRFKFRYVLYAILLIYILSIEWDNIFKHTSTADKKVVPTIEKKEAHKATATKKSGGKPSVNQSKENQATQLLDEQAFDDAESIELEQLESLEQVDESMEGVSTLELLERKNHADVVEQAKRKGVSTEGTTLEILERINHADVVEQAKRKGVSTEGTTLEILERINHADVVKRAKQMGVNTEGTTLEILERINRKSIEERNR